MRSASRNKSRRGVHIEFHDSSARRSQVSLCIGVVRVRGTKDPGYKLGAVHGEQMLSKAGFTHLSDSLSLLSESKLLRFPPFSFSLHNKPDGARTGV